MLLDACLWEVVGFGGLCFGFDGGWVSWCLGTREGVESGGDVCGCVIGKEGGVGSEGCVDALCIEHVHVVG